MNYSFDEKIDRFKTPSAKFHPEYLKNIFGTDDLYPFWVADMDFKSPPQILEAFSAKLEEGVFGYEYKPNTFMPSLINWYKTRFNSTINKDWVQFTPTIMSSMAMALDLFTSKNDGVIIQPPVYMEFSNTVKKLGRSLITNPLKLINLHYEIDFEELNKLAQDKNNKVLLFCNPHNPGGRVWRKEELQQVVAICLKHNILLIADEIHADVVFSNGEFNTLLNFPEFHDQLIVCYSPAKVFNIASITDSIAIIPNEELRNKFNNLRLRYNLGRTNAFSRIAMETGFTHAQNWVDELNSYIEKNMQLIQNYLQNNIPEITMVKQEGTYLVWLNVEKLPIKGDKLIRFLGKEAKIGLNNGSAFGKEGRGFVRMNIACPKQIIEDALVRLQNAIELLKIQNI